MTPPAAASRTTSSSVPPEKLRVLCLHGFRTNGHVMQAQMRALKSALGDNTEVVYLNGPFEAQGKAFGGVEEQFKDVRPFYEWMQYYIGDERESADLTPVDAARLVERMGAQDPWYLGYRGIEHALAYMDQKLQALGPFDVAIGFSQGAVMLTVFAMWCLHTQNKRWWKLAVCISTARVNGANCKSLFVTPEGNNLLVPFPSVHIIGKKDPTCGESRKMAMMYDHCPIGNPTGRIILEHEEGHRFPSFKHNAALYATLVDVMNKYRHRASTSRIGSEKSVDASAFSRL